MARKAIDHLVLSDIHYPLHHSEALREVLSHVKSRYSVCNLHILGDAYDLAGLSGYVNSARQVADVAGEIEAGRTFYEDLKREIRPKRAFFYLGNHEARLIKYLRGRAPALEKVIDETLVLVPRGYELANERWGGQVVDGIYFSHGVVCRKDPGKSAAVTLLEHADGCVGAVIGHTHRLAVVYHKNRWAAESGHLSDVSKHEWLRAEPSWTLGFLIIDQGGPYAQSLLRAGRVGA